MKTKNNTLSQLTGIQRVALVTVGILLIPLLGRFPWGVFDFVIVGALIFGTGCLLDYVSRKVEPKHRIFATLAILAVFFVIWAELAVGLVSQAVTGELWVYDLL